MRAAPDGAPNEWTTEDDPRITPVRPRAAASPTSTSCPRCSTSSRATWPWSGPGPSSRSTSTSCARSCPSTTSATWCGPGLTGWAQVKYGYAGDERDALEKLQYEFYYLRHQSLGLDLRIVGRTIRSVLGRGGR